MLVLLLLKTVGQRVKLHLTLFKFVGLGVRDKQIEFALGLFHLDARSLEQVFRRQGADLTIDGNGLDANPRKIELALLVADVFLQLRMSVGLFQCLGMLRHIAIRLRVVNDLRDWRVGLFRRLSRNGLAGGE